MSGVFYLSYYCTHCVSCVKENMKTEQRSSGAKERFGKKFFFGVILIFCLYTLIESMSLFGLFLLKKFRYINYSPIPLTSLSKRHIRAIKYILEGKTNYNVYSPTLGWAIRPNGKSGPYRANSKGIRSSREYSLVPSENVIRISSFGDSFTHCDDVKNRDTWQSRMSNSNLEVINFGVGGFGLDQAFLRYQQEGVLYNSDIVLIGFMTENINRVVNVFRPFYFPSTGIPLSKPYFTISGGQLVLNKNPMYKLSLYRKLLDDPEELLAKLGVNDYFFHKKYAAGGFDFLPSVRISKILYGQAMEQIFVPKVIKSGYYNRDSRAFKVTCKIFDKFIDTVSENKSSPIVVIFPRKDDFLRYRKDKTKVHAPLLEYLKSKKYQYIDILDAFGRDKENINIDDLFVTHYSATGNKLVAKYILNYIKENKLLAK